MVKTAFLAALLSSTLSWAALPAQAQLTPETESELRTLGRAFLATPGEDSLTRIRDLARAGRDGTASGTLSLGVFDGALTPLEGIVPVAGREDYALACRTRITSDFPREDVTHSRDRIELRHQPGGAVDFHVTTDRAATRLAVLGRSDGQAAALGRWIYTGPEGSMDVRPIGTTPLYRDDVTRAVLTPEAPNRRLIDELLAAMVAGNPAWFLNEGDVRLGQSWLGNDAEDGALPRILALAGPLLGAGAGFDDLEIVSAVSGRHRAMKRDGVVVEYAGRMGFTLPASDLSLTLALTGYEVYDIATLARLDSRFAMSVTGQGVDRHVEQVQRCAMN
ncbi:hypothetical protein [Pararhodobacter sp. CCB-MM2]|uniref:hypothetical protein n=1 Tax=Pararhodobacter sp. CCB-MM2 TaxID=1786003 RepID=UPI000829E2F6|nr:hypothetical protein [Pararhodobacter sp. CCB-MM2]